ncbi:MAG: hypothetical protein Q9207_003501 [Kuettlingeria erythrocarpa]
MKTRVHEATIGHVGDGIRDNFHLDALRRGHLNPSNIAEIKKITQMGTPTLSLSGAHRGAQFEADLAYKTDPKQKYPNLLIEVAVSEMLEHLHSKAHQWVSGTDGDVGWVLGIKLMIPVDPNDPFLNLKLRHFLPRTSTLPSRIKAWPVTIPLLPLVEQIDGAIHRQAMDVAEKEMEEKAHRVRENAVSLTVPVPTPAAKKGSGGNTSRYNLRQRDPKKTKASA